MAFTSVTRGRLHATLASVIATLLWWRFRGAVPACFAGLMGALALLAWFAPASYAPVQRVLDRFAHAILAGFTWLVLGIVYFGVFTPLRCWRALRRRDPLRLRATPGGASYFQPLPPAAKRRFDRQF